MKIYGFIKKPLLKVLFSGIKRRNDVWIEIEPEVSLLLTDKNEQEVKAFLYSKFKGDKELLIKQEGFEDERLKLNDIFNEI